MTHDPRPVRSAIKVLLAGLVAGAGGLAMSACYGPASVPCSTSAECASARGGDWVCANQRCIPQRPQPVSTPAAPPGQVLQSPAPDPAH